MFFLCYVFSHLPRAKRCLHIDIVFFFCLFRSTKEHYDVSWYRHCIVLYEFGVPTRWTRLVRKLFCMSSMLSGFFTICHNTTYIFFIFFVVFYVTKTRKNA